MAKQKKFDSKTLFNKSELKPFNNIGSVGKYVVWDSQTIKEQYRQRKFLVWKVLGGWGTEKGKISNAIYCECVADGEQAKFYISDFSYEFIGDISTLV